MPMASDSAQLCFATAATERFVPGALVAIASFLEHHPRFSGDLVLFHDGLPEERRRQLLNVCGRLRFEPISPELRERLDALRAARPDFAPSLGQFLSLEAFRLRGYRKVLFYDSDVLFQDSITELFDSPAALLCCGDLACLQGRRRDAETFAIAPPGAEGALADTFGAGFLLIDAALQGCHQDLLALVSPDTWRGTDTPHTDQFILNRRLAGRQTLVSWTYDFVLLFAEGIRQREGVAADNAKVLHFAGPVKPWMPDAMLRWTQGDDDAKPQPAHGRWHDAYVRHLAAAHRRHARPRAPQDPPVAAPRKGKPAAQAKRIPGANQDLDRLIKTHLFVICPNNSGSSFLAGALEKCRAVWRLPREGQATHGYAGPLPWLPHGPDGWTPGLLWAAGQRWIDLFSDPGNYDWPRTRKAWRFHSYARDPNASVFVTKSPPHLLCAEQLAQHFRGARFLFMVRNPYAVCEGICRRHRTRLPAHHLDSLAGLGMSLPEAAAAHVANCLAWQRRNIEAHRRSGLFFTYEEMCGQPAAVAGRIQALAPELADLDLRQRIAAKDYDEPLTNMNPRQLARLDGGQIAAFNKVLRRHRDLLAWFGYDLMDPQGHTSPS